MIKLLKNMQKREWLMALVCAVLVVGQIYFDLTLPDYMTELTTLKIGSCAFTFNRTNYTAFNEEYFDSCSESEDEDVSWLIMKSVCFCFHQ